MKRYETYEHERAVKLYGPVCLNVGYLFIGWLILHRKINNSSIRKKKVDYFVW